MSQDEATSATGSGPINPDCAVGKHPACRGDAWDLAADRPTHCRCICHHEKRAA